MISAGEQITNRQLKMIYEGEKITNMQLKAISLKIRFYKKHNKNAEYLQAAGPNYEISVKMEKESKEMMNNVLNLRNRLERANRERKAVEMENLILAEKSETDSLTESRAKLESESHNIRNDANKTIT